MHGMRDWLATSGGVRPSSPQQLPAALDRIGERVAELGGAAARALERVRQERSERRAGGGAGAADELLGTLEQRLAQLAREASALADLVERAGAALQEPPPAEGPKEAPGPEGSPASVSPGIRIIASQMAAEGSSPEEIEARLREEFGIRSAHEVVEAVLRSSVR